MPETPIDQASVDPATRVQLKGLRALHRVWDGFREAADDLGRAVGVPLCVEGCGLCCVTNTPAAYGIEVSRARDWLLTQTPAYRTMVLNRIETWLTRDVLDLREPLDPSLTVTHPRMGKGVPSISNLELVATARGRCPLLGDDLRCTVHEVRPLACRAYGVTRTADAWCQRPAGQGETATTRSIFGGDGTATLRARIRLLLETIKGHPKLTNTAFFPTALYAQFREKRLIELLPNVASAKLAMGQNVFQGRLFEEPLAEPFVPDVPVVA